MIKVGRLQNGSLVVEKGVKVGTLYLCTVHIVPSTLIFLEENECSRTIATIEQGEQIAIVIIDIVLWNNILEHMSEKGMKVLRSKTILSRLKCVNMDFYESCVYGKQKRVSFVKSGKENNVRNFLE